MASGTTIDFSGKVAIVTGGASGMGAATARLITESGGRVVIADIDATTGAAHAAELGKSARFVRTDVTRVEDTQRLMAATIEAFGRIDVLFNNAGKGSLGDAATLEPAGWYEIIDVNLNSAYLMTKAALPHLKTGGGGAIVNTASVSGLAGDYGMVAYNAAKAGLVNLTRSLAIDHAKDKIRVNAVCPGIIADTAMASKLADGPGGLETWNARIPLRRTGFAIEVARVMVFVASDLASYMTGSVIVVDGGLTAHTGMPTPDDFSAAARSS
ncbi:MAG TPA: SDR family NAD(P)-dependent oxidoreductase [Stellaceae bacterium]|nr:SDR family NAD(P)-dependent oxidoreductase [Stellaceae bacterium]